MTRAVFLASLLITSLGVGVCASEREAAPGFSLYDSEGTKRKLSDYQGQVVLLNFWATWCAPCRTEIPWLKDIHEEYSREGFAVVGVAMDERGWRAVTPFLAEYDVDYPVLLGNAKVARLYGGLETLPKTLFLDRKGRIVAVHEAILSKAHLRKIVELLLAEKD